jgi:phosphoglycerate kinase
MRAIKTLQNLIDSQNLVGKKILVRADLNVPTKHGKIIDATRIVGVIPTIVKLIETGAKVIIISHFGRPDGVFDSNYSLSPIVDELSTQISNYRKKETTVKFGTDCIGAAAEKAISQLENGDVILLENIRFHSGETKNTPEFAKALADLADFYVNDAFSCSHRAHASITGVTEFLPAYAGDLIEKEISSLQNSLENPTRPVAAIVGGSKVSTKIEMLESLVTKVDFLMIGGGMANTFLYAMGNKIGKSLCEKDYVETVKNILAKAKQNNCQILLPTDSIIANSIENGENCQVAGDNNIPDDKMILDAGINTVVSWHKVLETCKTVVWNGPIGAFEFKPFDNATIALARSVAYFTKNNGLLSVAGGGDTVAVVSASGLRESFSYISTAGGAFLEWLEGKELPGVKVLYK